MDWLEAHFDLSSPGFWAFVTIALAILVVNIAWLVVRVSEGPRTRTIARVLRSSAVQALAWLIASLYLLLPPFLAWRYGAISSYLLGLAELDWIESLRAGGPFVGIVIALAVFGWLVYRHTLPGSPVEPAGDGRLLHALRAPIDAILTQWHLAFGRALMIAWLPTVSILPAALPNAILAGMQAQSFYWGSWLGLGLLLIEAGLNPFFRDLLQAPTAEDRRLDKPEALLCSFGLAAATTGLFVLTRNLWLCIACQVVVDTVIAGWLPLYRSEQQTAG
jgi:hypothetical protein